MNDFVLLNTPVAVVLLALLILFGIGFCLLVLLFQNECERNRVLKKRNSQLRERLSLTQQELNSRGYHLPDSDTRRKDNAYG